MLLKRLWLTRFLSAGSEAEQKVEAKTDLPGKRVRRPSKKAAALADGLAVSPDHLQFSEEAKGRKTGKRQPQKRKRGSDLDDNTTGSLLPTPAPENVQKCFQYL